MKVCRICLCQQGRHYAITGNILSSLYYQLTEIPKQHEHEDRLPQWVCAECGLRLMSYNKLKQKSLRSHQILTELLDRVSYITEDHINQIDKVLNDLEPTFTHYTANIDYDFKEEPKTINVVEKKQIKSEKEKKIKVESISDDDEHSETVDVGNASDVSDVNKDDDDSFTDLEEACQSSDSSESENVFTKRPTSQRERLEQKKRVDEFLNLLTKKPSNSTGKRGRKKVATKTKVSKRPDPYPIDDLFTVQSLTFEEQRTEIESRQYSKNYIDAPFKCDVCFKGFVTKVTFARHQLRHTDKWGKEECAICKYRYPSKGTYNKHMSTHKVRYSCKQCKFTACNRSGAVSHGMTHKGKLHQCPHCDMQFTIKTSFLSHLRIIHVSQFACEFCGFAFVSAKGVDHHKNLKHRLERDIVVPADGPECATCNIRFISDEALSTHLRISHTEGSLKGKMRNDEVPPRKGRVACELCGVPIRDGRSYRTHFRRYHPGVVPTKVFKQARRLKPAMCEQCGRVFKSKYNLLQHAVVHTRQKPFHCHECDRSFSFQAALYQHTQRLHRPKQIPTYENKETFPCNICGKEFTTAGNATRHMVIHSDMRPFTCEICGSTFKTKYEVKIHTTHVHLKMPWPKKRSQLHK